MITLHIYMFPASSSGYGARYGAFERRQTHMETYEHLWVHLGTFDAPDWRDDLEAQLEALNIRHDGLTEKYHAELLKIKESRSKLVNRKTETKT